MDKFDIPVVLFIFKRIDTVKIILDRLSVISPKKLYIIADGPRDKYEIFEVEECRKIVENRISWNCELIKNYASANRGVYENIAGGVKWVFEKEEFAIFLEDDNLPELTFFPFCKELLLKYKNDPKILWICGTNYLKEYYSKKNDYSYYFTKNMLPCGWASWKEKFLKYYDGRMSLFDPDKKYLELRKSYKSKSLFRQDLDLWKKEKKRISEGKKPISWDHQMSFSLRVNGLYGIIPRYNQITNIGVDTYSIHGGNSMKNIMVKRFCELPSKRIEFPLRHPPLLSDELDLEKKIEKIILEPFFYRMKYTIIKILKYILFLPQDKSLSSFLKHTR